MRMCMLHEQFAPDWGDQSARWRGNLQPTSISSVYLVEITYRLNGHPKVAIVSPVLEPCTEGARIPHTYNGNLPCIYWPRLREWTPQLFIADTIVPWTSLWLYFYEVWGATGSWLGDGVHPSVQEGRQGDGDCRPRHAGPRRSCSSKS